MAADLKYKISVERQTDPSGKWYIECAGPSQAEKPGDDYLGAGVMTGSLATETDTGDVYMFQEGASGSAGEWGKICALGGSGS